MAPSVFGILILSCLFLCLSAEFGKNKEGELVFQAGHRLSGPERFTNVVLVDVWDEDYAAENTHILMTF